MAIELRTATPDDVEALVLLDLRNFGEMPEDGDIEEFSRELDLDRFLLAWDGSTLVAAAGTYEMDLTLPGLATVPMSAVTWVSVAASHRRRGLAGQLMAGLDEMAVGLDEPLLGLTASEGGIYERFGYGVATDTRVVQIDRRQAVLQDRWQPDPVELIDAQDHVAALYERWERFRRGRVGEVSRTEGQHRMVTLDRKKPAYAALHPDGYVIYALNSEWNDGHPAHQLRVVELVAVTPEAHLALWNLVLSVDLVGPIRCIRSMALDDPLPQLLTDPRAVRTTDLNDGLWLKVADPVRCFGARDYRVDDRLVVGVVETVDQLLGGEAPTQTVAVSPGATVEVDEVPDLVATRPALGPLLLGGSTSALARGHRVTGDPEVLSRADALFGTGIRAHCATPF
ncbi:MAG: GNAT family N-acetyltransferase [Actinomycetota bacterium]